MQRRWRRSRCRRQRAFWRVEIYLRYVFLGNTWAGPAQFCNRSTGVFVVFHNDCIQTTPSRKGNGAASFRWLLILPAVDKALSVHPQPYTIIRTGVECISLSLVIFGLHLACPAYCEPIVWHCWPRRAIAPIKRYLRVYPCQNQVCNTGEIGRGGPGPAIVFPQQSRPSIVTRDELRDVNHDGRLDASILTRRVIIPGLYIDHVGSILNHIGAVRPIVTEIQGNARTTRVPKDTVWRGGIVVIA